MKKVYRSACPMDCFATCGLLVYTENGRVTDIKGDPQNLLTRGKVCSKVFKQLARLYSPQRILHPLLREGSTWRRIGWDEALNLWASKLVDIKKRYGTTAVLHHDGGGSGGVLRGLGERFFNVYGGVTQPEGSLCWASGLVAQELDFGGHQAHEWDDLANSGTVILWGRDPAHTNVQLLEHIKRAHKNGAEIIAINPLRIKTGVPNTRYICPQPGTDGALALGMAQVLIAENLLDNDFIDRHVLGFEEFAASISAFTPEHAQRICGVPAGEIIDLARRYATCGPSAIWFGFGVQRYANAGRTMRCIDALAALTGNIGVPGGGANYVYRSWNNYFSHLKGSEYAKGGRTFPWPSLARHIGEADDPPVKCIVVTRSNPLTQLPDINRAKKAFRATDFVVVVDFFITDTAAEADLVLPCTTFMEGEDIIISSWNNYISYTPEVIQPLGESRSDLDIFTDLARRMGLADFSFMTTRQWLEHALEPLADLGINLEKLKQSPMRHPTVSRVAWPDRKFNTSSGKYELYSQKATELGLEPLPVYRPPQSMTKQEREYPFYLLTPHHRDFLHSQFWNLVQPDKLGRLPAVEVHPENLAVSGLEDGCEVWVESPQGRLSCIIKTAKDIKPGVVRIYQGRWVGQDGGVNFLTPDTVSDLGKGSCYYDCRCRIYKKNKLF